MHDGNGDGLDKDVDKSSGLDNPQEHTDQSTTEKEETVPVVPENLVTDSRDLRLVGELLQKIDNVCY